MRLGLYTDFSPIAGRGIPLRPRPDCPTSATSDSGRLPALFFRRASGSVGECLGSPAASGALSLARGGPWEI